MAKYALDEKLLDGFVGIAVNHPYLGDKLFRQVLDDHPDYQIKRELFDRIIFDFLFYKQEETYMSFLQLAIGRFSSHPDFGSIVDKNLGIIDTLGIHVDAKPEDVAQLKRVLTEAKTQAAGIGPVRTDTGLPGRKTEPGAGAEELAV